MAYIIRKPNLMIIKLLDMTFSLVSYPNLIKLNKNYFYIDIPKSGSSFIKSSIIQNGNSIIKISEKYPHSALFKRTLLINSIKEKKIITFIRDPIERFCSVIRQKILFNKHLGGFSPSNFFKHYLDHPKLEILHTSQISRKLLEIGIKEASFPNKEISLHTNKDIFNQDNLSQESIKILQDYYKDDYKILKKIKKND